ncbi:PrsW family intramembrane metalloprotease, partial [Patescibacteria group bacterium]|nr:PrsW family intramembrane metalloprotease [Patescibacteria group bacterium]
AVAFEFAADYFFSFAHANTLTAIIFGSLLVVAPIEELLKYFVVREAVVKNPNFDEPVDGVIYAVVAALGFASLENILVVFGEGGEIILLRFATATLMHALTSGIVGYHLGLAMIKPEKKKSLVIQGLVIAILLHALYNISVSLSNSFAITIILLTVLLGSMFIILSRGIKELKSYKPAKTKASK